MLITLSTYCGYYLHSAFSRLCIATILQKKLQDAYSQALVGHVVYLPPTAIPHIKLLPGDYVSMEINYSLNCAYHCVYCVE